MSVRTIALVFPLALGISCMTSSRQGSDHTGAMWPERATASSHQGGGSTGEAAQAGAQGSTSESPSPSTSESSDSGTVTTSTESGSAVSGDVQGSESGSSTGGGGSSEAGSPGLGSQGPDAADSGSPDSDATAEAPARPEEETVSGRLSKVSGTSISIRTTQGESTMLKIVPETVFTMNGKTAKLSQLRRGQPVRASFNEQDGENVAVRIDAKRSPSRKASGSGSGMGR